MFCLILVCNIFGEIKTFNQISFYIPDSCLPVKKKIAPVASASPETTAPPASDSKSVSAVKNLNDAIRNHPGKSGLKPVKKEPVKKERAPGNTQFKDELASTLKHRRSAIEPAMSLSDNIPYNIWSSEDDA